MNRDTHHTITGCIVAIALGGVIGAMRSSSRTAEPIRPTPSNAETPSINEPLARAMKTETGAKRWLLLVAASEHAAAQDMPGLLRAVGDDEAAQAMIVTHWAKLNPKHMFTSLYADYLLPEGSPAALPNREWLAERLISQWMKSDPAAALKALNEVPEFSGLKALRNHAIEALISTDFEAGLRAMSEWRLRPYISQTKSVEEWAARDPRRATELAASLSQQGSLRSIVAKAWADSDPAAGVEFVAALRPPVNAYLGADIVSSWAKKDAAAAAKFVADLGATAFRNATAEGLVSTWGETDAAAALAWSEQNLRGKARTETVAALIEAASKRDLATASKLVSDMDEGDAQNQAVAALFEAWSDKGKEQRAEAIKWLLDLPEKEMQRAALDKAGYRWVEEDPEGARDFISGPHGDLASNGVINRVASQLVSMDPESAMEWATKLPEPRTTTARAAAFQQWLALRPDAAAKYASKLPVGPLREHAISSVTDSLILISPEKAAAWISNLPAAEQKKAVANLDGYDPKVKEKMAAAMKQNGK